MLSRLKQQNLIQYLAYYCRFDSIKGYNISSNVCFYKQYSLYNQSKAIDILDCHNLPITFRCTFQYLVGDFLKSTRHLYVPASSAFIPRSDSTAVGSVLVFSCNNRGLFTLYIWWLPKNTSPADKI